MEFDEYDYLEKTVEEMEISDVSSLKNKDGKQKEKSGKEYRRRELHEVDDDEDLRAEERRKKKKSSHEENGGEKRDSEEREKSSRSDRHRRSSKDSERETEREKDRDRRRSSRDVGRDSDRDSRSREKRDKYKDKDRDREKERESERSRRSRSHSRHDHEREKELFREREEEHELRESRRFKDKKDAAEPEADPERDQRTVFAYQMPLKATERDVYEFFSKAGKVRDVRLIMDRNSRRSKGVGYIEFYDAMSVPMAITFCGQLLLGQPIMVKPSEAEKNLVQSNTTGAGPGGLAGPYGAADRKLYVGNLHFNMTEFQLKQIFEAFGTVELVQLPTDPETGHCKGFGFIQFAQIEHAKAAQSLNGKLEIAGRNIKVSLVTDHVTAQDSGAKTADFDDDDGGGLALNAQSRAMLMQKLDRTGVASSIVGAVGAPMLNGSAPVGLPLNMPAGIQALPPQILAALPPAEPIGNPTECLLLKNMFDPNMEIDPDFDLEIEEDVKEECSNYGRVKHIHVDKKSAGYVYLRFDSVEGATRAQQAMHKRWFARRLIAAIFLQRYEYDAKFKGAA